VAIQLYSLLQHTITNSESTVQHKLLAGEHFDVYGKSALIHNSHKILASLVLKEALKHYPPNYKIAKILSRQNFVSYGIVSLF